MANQKHEYKKDWDNERIVEHTLTHNSTDEQRCCLGPIDFHSPSRAMNQKESESGDDEKAVQEDAKACAAKLNFLLIAQEASSAEGIHRANACAALRILSALKFHCDGQNLEAIGSEIGKERQVVDRYAKRFVSWSAENCKALCNKVTPELVIEICSKEVSSTQSLAEILDGLRIALSDLLNDLTNAANDPERSQSEVYSDISRFWEAKNSPVNLTELLETV